jgi:hypothetical protein
MTHPAHPAPFTISDWVLLAIICSPIAALYAVGIARMRHARSAVQLALRKSGFEIVRLKQRFLRQGPFFFHGYRSDIVYRVTARDAQGRERAGWARWGRIWVFGRDSLEVRWDE